MDHLKAEEMLSALGTVMEEQGIAAVDIVVCGAMVLLILGAVLTGFAIACWTANRRAKERKDELQDQLESVRAERQRLTDRLRRLEAGLDEEANQL